MRGQLAVPADHLRGLALLPPALGPAPRTALHSPHRGGQVPCSAQEAAVTRRWSGPAASLQQITAQQRAPRAGEGARMWLLLHVIHRAIGYCLWEVSDTGFGGKKHFGCVY